MKWCNLISVPIAMHIPMPMDRYACLPHFSRFPFAKWNVWILINRLQEFAGHFAGRKSCSENELWIGSKCYCFVFRLDCIPFVAECKFGKHQEVQMRGKYKGRQNLFISHRGPVWRLVNFVNISTSTCHFICDFVITCHTVMTHSGLFIREIRHSVQPFFGIIFNPRSCKINKSIYHTHLTVNIPLFYYADVVL